MWVCYFKNAGDSSSIYRYRTEYISPSYIKEKKSYNIESIDFEGEKFNPLKIYQQSDKEIICIVGENFKDNFLVDNFLFPTIEITLRLCLDSEEEIDSKYSEEGYPLCDSTHYQISRDLANSLRQVGIKVVGYKQMQEKYLQIKISADTMQECIIDAEFCRFFSTAIFRNVLGKFVTPRKKLNGSIKVTFGKKDKLEKIKNENLVEKISYSEDSIELSFDKPDLNILRKIPEVLSLENA